MKQKNRFIRWAPLSLLILSFAVLLLSKISSLHLPHYWDEAFPYSYAIGHMSEKGSGILSDTAPTHYTTGHPLIYYFVQSNWNNLVGGIIWLERLLPMMISLSMLLLVYLIGKKIKSEMVGGIAALLLSTHSTFLAQASFQLPETMLSLFLLMCIYFSLTKQNWSFVLAATGLVFTKETGVVLLFILFTWFVLSRIKQIDMKTLITSTWIFAIPVGLNFLFYLHQYYVQGWFLFPRHTGFIRSEMYIVWNQFGRYFAHLFIYEGRNITFFTALSLTLLYFIIKRKKLVSINLNPVLLLLSGLILAFLSFSAFNFYSERYILCLFPLFALLSGYVLCVTLSQNQWVPMSLGIVLAIITLTRAHTKLNPTDHSLGYVDAVITQQHAIDYCIEMDWNNKPVQTSFLMSKNLTSHYPRYLTKDELFTAVNNFSNPTEVVILCSNEPEEHLLKLVASKTPAKLFESGQEWCKIYLFEK